MASHIVFVTFAPIASPTSTSSSTMSIWPDGTVMVRHETSFAPRPSLGRVVLLEFARSSILPEDSKTFCSAPFMAPTSCTCPTLYDSSDIASKPPRTRAALAPFDAAAMTDGSSMAMGTRQSLPFIIKLVATPSGSAKVPSAFSTIVSARSKDTPPSGPFSMAISLVSSPAKSATSPRRSALVFE